MGKDIIWPQCLADVFKQLALRLKSRAKWCESGYYSDAAEVGKMDAKRELYEELAEELEALANEGC